MKNLKAVMTALITPFKKGEIDWKSLENLVKHQLENGVEGFVVLGTTGESPTVKNEERKKVFSFIQSQVGGQVPLVLGTGTNSTEESIRLTKEAKAWGADAALVVVPYYNKPPQRGLLQHFTQVAQVADFPVLLYNVPGRTITSLEPETVQQLSEVPQIIGIKEATGNIELFKKMKKLTRADFIYLSGDDGTYVDFLNEGGHGVISVTSHIFPREMVKWRLQVAEGKSKLALEEAPKYLALTNKLFCEANPIPVKKALQIMGIIEQAELRLPLCEMNESLAKELKQEMQKCGVLK